MYFEVVEVREQLWYARNGKKIRVPRGEPAGQIRKVTCLLGPIYLNIMQVYTHHTSISCLPCLHNRFRNLLIKA